MQANNSVQTCIYYGVHVPNEQPIQENDGSKKVFFDKIEALKEVKKYKKARFKAFNFYHEALEFALYGSEHPNNNSMIEINGTPSNAAITPTKTDVVASSVGEKPSQFRGPKSQDLVKFRKAIESGNVQLVQTTVWENPRYLISSGDTPAILQEGSRYNALHVAAKSKNAEMCDIILTTVSNPAFIQMLYGEENKTNSEEGSKILLDLYLNTPDKGLNETPLHFAVKFGAVNVVEVLVSYPQCNKTVLNKFSQMPKDIICSRVQPCPMAVNKILSLLEDTYYVPVLRSEDNCMQPLIGQPFSPNSPPELNKNPINPRMEIHAYAGPMKRDEADVFRKKWKTPPRTPGSPMMNLKLLRSPCSAGNNHLIRLQDTEKGLERIGRDLAKQSKIGWKEYWGFLGTFADLSSENGLNLLENHIKALYISAFNDSVSNCLNSSDLSDEIIVNNSLNTSGCVVSPMTELCKNFESCSLNDKETKRDFGLPQRRKATSTHSMHINETILDAISKSGLSPCLCVEKSCQVFATRIANHLIFLVENQINHASDALETEIKHLKSLIGSYMSDSRFTEINFQSIHWRIAQLVGEKLREIFLYDDEIPVKRKILENVIKIFNKTVDVFSSDDEEFNNYRQLEKPIRRKSTSNNKQVICLVSSILKALDAEENEKTIINTEEDCIKVWANAMVCNCVWKTISKSGRKNSYKKKFGRTPNNRLSRALDNVSRRLTFIEDEIDAENRGDYLEINNGLSSEKNLTTSSFGDTSSSSEDDIFYDAISIPFTSDTEEERFEDPEPDTVNVFLEGNEPTKTDYVVYTAVRDVYIDRNLYSNVYRWRHSVSLFQERERVSWSNRSPNSNINSQLVTHNSPLITYSPPHSWLRITGSNSPLKSLQALQPMHKSQPDWPF